MKRNRRTDMENVEHFGTLTERMKEFREEVLDEKPYIDAQRAILATLAYKENLNQPRVMVRAKMLEKVLDNMSIYIEDKSLLARNQATKNRNAPIFPEYTMEFVMNELDQFEKRDGDIFYITEKTKEQLREMRHSGRITICVQEEKLFFLKKFVFLWKQVYLEWKVS